MTETRLELSENEILDSLKRSGYIFESEITKQLIDNGYFVESNLVSLDPITGKSREIDLQAELHFERQPTGNQTVANTRFIFEIKNNNAPIVLMTEFGESPHAPIWDGLKVVESVPTKLKGTRIKDHFNHLYFDENMKLFTQYCSFSKKNHKDEIMANHPENLYSSIQKITYFCEEIVDRLTVQMNTNDNEIWRNFLYLPIILIKQDLFELEISDNHDLKLNKVDISRLVFNYHYKQEAKTSIVYMVTQTGLTNFMKKLEDIDRLVQDDMDDKRRIVDNLPF